MENEEINNKILGLWEKYPKESGEHSPLLYPEFKRNAILVIGLNPSLSKKAFNIIFKDTEYRGAFTFEEFFKKENIDEYKDIYIKEGKWAKEKYSYYKKIRESWKEFEHIDLFVYRITNQNYFKKNCLKCGKELKEDFVIGDFWLEQLKISLEAIKMINPKIIIVANAFASDIINKYKELFKLNNTDNFELKGYDVLKIGERDMPILFSSMLTQQRALDNHSFRRLVWQVKKILCL